MDDDDREVCSRCKEDIKIAYGGKPDKFCAHCYTVILAAENSRLTKELAEAKRPRLRTHCAVCGTYLQGELSITHDCDPRVKELRAQLVMNAPKRVFDYADSVDLPKLIGVERKDYRYAEHWQQVLAALAVKYADAVMEELKKGPK